MAKGQQRSSRREAFWRGVLTRFGASGLNVRSFCARERLTEPSFYAWRRTIQRRDAEQPRPAFVPLMVDDVTSAGREPAIVIELRDCPRPLVLRLPVALPLGQVAELVRAIAAGPDVGTRTTEERP